MHGSWALAMTNLPEQREERESMDSGGRSGFQTLVLPLKLV